MSERKKKTGLDCAKEDGEDMDIIQKALDMIIGHTNEDNDK